MSRSAPASLASTSQQHALALALSSSTDKWEVSAATSDLELRLLRALGDSLAGSYVAVKRSSRLTSAVATAAEDLATSSGLAALLARLQPWVQVVDDAVSKRVLELMVSVLLLADIQGDSRDEGQQGLLLLRDSAAQHPGDLEGGGDRYDAVGRLSHRERIRALLSGDLPRVQALLQDARRRELDAVMEQQRLEQAQLAPVVMELKDFVPVDEVKRIKDANRELLLEKQHEVTALREQLSALEREKQQLEQDLTDVHSYQASERGQRFQEMEVSQPSYLGVHEGEVAARD